MHRFYNVFVNVFAVARSVLFISLIALAVSPRSAAAGLCHDSVVLYATDELRGLRLEAGESRCFRLEIDEPGVLLVEVAAPSSAVAEPLLRLHHRLDPRGAQLVSAAPTWLLVHFSEPGSHFFRVTAQDPRQPLAFYKIRSRFLRDDGLSNKDRDSDEIDPELPPPSPVSSASSAALCPQNALDDDHSDFFTCATQIVAGQETVGEIVNPWGDDADVFFFAVRSLVTVEISGRSESELVGTLYDRHGYRIAADEDSGGLRIVKALVPGYYFIRVEGSYGDGRYRLNLETLD